MTEMKRTVSGRATKRADIRIPACGSGRTGNADSLDRRYKRYRLFRADCAGGTESADGGVQNPKATSKTGATEFVFEHLEIDLEGKVFLPMQQLNELRRQALKN